jgi:hypothetical protein
VACDIAAPDRFCPQKITTSLLMDADLWPIFFFTLKHMRAGTAQ